MGHKEAAAALTFCTHQAVHARAGKPTPEGAQSPTSPHTWAPWAAARRAARALRPLLYRLPGVHHTEATNVSPEEATEREMAGRGGAERGAPPQVRAGRACFCAGVRPACASLRAGARLGACLSLRRRPALRARSRFPRGARGHKGLQGKRGARPTSVERLQVANDLERIFGAGAGLAGTASLVPPYAPFPSFPFHLLSLF